MIYIPANENICGTRSGGKSNTCLARTLQVRSSGFPAPGADHFGEVQAWNVDTGLRVWTRYVSEIDQLGPDAATGGGLVFSGGTNDRLFRAYDAKTGKVLVEFPTTPASSAAPTMIRRRRHPVASRCSPVGALTPAASMRG